MQPISNSSSTPPLLLVYTVVYVHSGSIGKENFGMDIYVIPNIITFRISVSSKHVIFLP